MSRQSQTPRPAMMGILTPSRLTDHLQPVSDEIRPPYPEREPKEQAGGFDVDHDPESLADMLTHSASLLHLFGYGHRVIGLRVIFTLKASSVPSYRP